MSSLVNKKVIDCCLFLQEKCDKGHHCEYRHSRAALESKQECVAWMKTGMCIQQQNCRQRHLGNESLSMKCSVCFDDFPVGEMVKCEENHAFCGNCVQGMVKEKLGEKHHQVNCLSYECKQVYKTSDLGRVLEKNEFAMLMQNLWIHDVKLAGIANLCECPFCDFKGVIDEPDAQVFRCENPKCSKVSCRNCDEMDHRPIRCKEVERDEAVKMRTFIEEECARALIRKCPSCAKLTIKESGCNHMTCTCKAEFCYVCNAKIPGVGHFAVGTCKQHTSIEEVHREVTLKAGKQAQQIYRAQNPTVVTEDILVEKLV